MSGLDEPSDFDLLMEELEAAADAIGGGGAADDEGEASEEELALADWGRTFTELKEEPKSLLDLRNLTFGDDSANPFTMSVDLADELEVGTVVDNKYEILGEAPRSTAGWEARHVVLRQKFILQPLARSIVDDPFMWPKFQSDIRSAGMLGHENIEFVTDLGRCEQYGPYLVKQWIEGPNLGEWLRENGRQHPSVAVDFAHTVGTALAALHEIGIVHGRLSEQSVCRVETQDGEVWKLLDVCIPGGDDPLLAPEQQRGEGTGPEADQYAVALLMWRLMLGVDAGPESDAGLLPEALVEVLLRALDDQPLMRWQDMDEFLGELLSAAPDKPAAEPQVHPFDRREASRQVQQQLEAKEAEAHSQGGFGERPRSMMIRVADASAGAGVEVEFNTGARLRREYRRNMVAGGLFIPTADDLRVGQPADITLRFAPSGEEVTVSAFVVNHDPGGPDRPRGFAVAFDNAVRKQVDRFVRSLGLGLGVSPNDRIEPKRALDMSANIDAGAAFLMSRLSGPMTVGSARAMFSGLPFDFDACLQTLVDEGFVSIESVDDAEPARKAEPKPAAARDRSASTPASRPNPAARDVVRREPSPAPKQTSEPTPRRPVSFSEMEWADIDRVLESVAYFEDQGNFMAAGRMLESASEHAPNIGAYHHRLALLRAKFDMDLAAARAAIRRARELDPKNEEFRASERYIATLVEMGAVRTIWDHDFGGPAQWLRTEPTLGFMWLTADGGSTLAEVNMKSRQAKLDRRSGAVAVAENSPKFDMVENRKPQRFESVAKRHERQVELAKRFGEFGPHFAKKPIGAARSENSVLVARAEGGLVIDRTAGTSITLSEGDVREVLFAPDDQQVAWLEKRDNAWVVYTAPITGPAAKRATLKARPTMKWSARASQLLVLDHDRSQLLGLNRQGGNPETVLDLRGSLELKLHGSTDDERIVVTGKRVVGKETHFATWLDPRTGKVAGDFPLPGQVSGAVVRSDGKFAAVLSNRSLFLANFANASQKTLDTAAVDADSLCGSKWSVGGPLYVASFRGGRGKVIAVDVELLCG